MRSLFTIGAGLALGQCISFLAVGQTVASLPMVIVAAVLLIVGLVGPLFVKERR